MAATLCGKILPRSGCLPLVQSLRHGSKAVTRHRKPMHFLKQKLLAVTEYIPPKAAAPPGALTPRMKKTQEDSGMMRMLKRHVEKVFQENKMIAVLQNNATNAEDMMLLKHRLRKHHITVRFFPNQVMRSFLPGSRYCNMLPLFSGQTVLFVSEEPKAKEMLQVLRNVPHMVLLGACIEHTLLSREGIISYSKLPTLRTAHSELVGGLTLMASHTVSLLERHPAHLSALLQQYIKQQQQDAATVEDVTA